MDLKGSGSCLNNMGKSRNNEDKKSSQKGWLRGAAGSYLSFVTGGSAGKIALCLVAITLVFSFQLRKAQFANSVEGWVESDDKALQDYRNFLDFFRGFEMIALSVECDEGVFSRECLKRVSNITNEIEEQGDHVKGLFSLSNVTTMKKIGLFVKFVPLMEKLPESSDDIKSFRDETMANPVIRKNMIARDEKSSLIAIFLGGGGQDFSYIPRNIDLIKRLMSAQTGQGIRFHLAGSMIMSREMNRQTRRQALKFAPLVFGLATILLLLLLKSFRDVFIVQVCTMMSLIWALGLYVWTGHVINFLMVAMPPLVLVISVADAVHMISRYREERIGGILPRKAVRSALAATIEPCLFTSLTTAVGFGVLTSSGIPVIRDFGIFTALGIIMAFMIAALIVPAMLILFDGRGEGSGVSTTASSASSKVFATIHNVSLKYRWIIILLSIVSVIVSSQGIRKIVADTNNKEFFAEDNPVRQDMDFVESQHAGLSSLEFMMWKYGENMLSPARVREMMDLQEFLEKQPEVTGSMSIADYLVELNRLTTGMDGKLPETSSIAWKILQDSRFGSSGEAAIYQRDKGRMTRVSVRVRYSSTSELRELKKRIDEYLASRPEGSADVLFTGSAMVYLSIADSVLEGQKKSFILVIIIVSLMMMLLFRSISWGIIGMIPSVIPIIIVMAFMGWAGIPLNLATMMIASISIGIAVDDTMHFMARCRREAATGMGLDAAARKAVMTTGRAMVITSVVLASGFGVLAFSSFVPIAEFGLLTALTMVFALAADLFLLPALLMTFKPSSGRNSDNK